MTDTISTNPVAKDVFWVATPDAQEVLYAGPGYENAWGRTCASLYRKPWTWLEAVHPEDRHRVRATIESDWHRDRRFKIDYRIVRPDGSLATISDCGVQILKGEGRVSHVAGIAQLTGEKADGTVIVPAKPEEFEDLTHDLNNELTVIMGYGWMLKNLPHNQETPADAVQEIARAGDRASAIVRRLLAARPQPLLVKAKGPIRRTAKILGRRLLRNPLAGLPTEEGEDGVPQARAVFARKLSDKLRGKKKGKTAGDEYENGAPLPMDDFGGDELM